MPYTHISQQMYNL